MRVETWCLRLTRQGDYGTYRIYLAFRDGMYLDQTPFRGSSARFYSEEDAHDYGNSLVRARRCLSYEVEHIPADAPLAHAEHGTGGIA